jgi:hypothetical protein
MVSHLGGCTEEQLQRLYLTLTTEKILVLDHMSDGEWVYPMATLASQIDLPVSIVRKILREFRDKGIAIYGHLTREDDSNVCGSGYFRSSLGEQLIGYIRSNRL